MSLEEVAHLGTSPAKDVYVFPMYLDSSLRHCYVGEVVDYCFVYLLDHSSHSFFVSGSYYPETLQSCYRLFDGRYAFH